MAGFSTNRKQVAAHVSTTPAGSSPVSSKAAGGVATTRRIIYKRRRASRRVPTTILETSCMDFRDTVQKLTGIHPSTRATCTTHSSGHVENRTPSSFEDEVDEEIGVEEDQDELDYRRRRQRVGLEKLYAEDGAHSSYYSSSPELTGVPSTLSESSGSQLPDTPDFFQQYLQSNATSSRSTLRNGHEDDPCSGLYAASFGHGLGFPPNFGSLPPLSYNPNYRPYFGAPSLPLLWDGIGIGDRLAGMPLPIKFPPAPPLPFMRPASSSQDAFSIALENHLVQLARRGQLPGKLMESWVQFNQLQAMQEHGVG